jgi:hypothetical protein
MADERQIAQHEHWSQFWRSAGSSLASEAVRLPVLHKLWAEILIKIPPPADGAPLLELAAGSGSVSRHISKISHLAASTQLALDASVEALSELRCGEIAVAGDLHGLPFIQRSMHLITSQFGVEYAGLDGFASAFDCVSAGGYFAFVIHLSDGVIHEECVENSRLIGHFLESSFLPVAQGLINTSTGAQLSPDHHQKAQMFRQTLSGVEQLLISATDGQAKDTLLQVYNAVADMVEAPRHYEAAVVDGWFSKTHAELAGYAQRMDQMCRSALSQQDRTAVTQLAEMRGFDITRHGIVYDDEDGLRPAPVAWHIVARRVRCDK